MTTLGIALIVAGVAVVCATMMFLLIVGLEPSSAEESFEESLDRLDHHVSDAQRTPQDLDDKSEPTEHVPDERERND